MTDLERKMIDTIEKVCDGFCKYNGTGDENGCVYCQTHCGECPFDDVIKEIEHGTSEG